MSETNSADLVMLTHNLIGKALHNPRSYNSPAKRIDKAHRHRLNMELDLLGAPYAQLYLLAETPQFPPSPAFGLIYESAIGQPR